MKTIARSLFDNPIAPKLARRTDPATSQLSAAQTEAELGDCHATMMSVMNDCFISWTAREVGAESADCNPKHEAETYRRRMHELVRLGLIEVCGRIKDETTGRTVQLYRKVK
jgi:hypothetical protein